MDISAGGPHAGRANNRLSARIVRLKNVSEYPKSWTLEGYPLAIIDGSRNSYCAHGMQRV